MKVGMLWFDNDTQSALDQKVRRAASYYLQKYGCEPSVCFVHPSMLPAGAQAPDDGDCPSSEIRIRTAAWILPNHYWLGLNGKDEGDGEDSG